jgi:hypothetical protein
MTRVDDISITEREASVLGPLAEHRTLIVPQVALLLGVTGGTALRRLRQLEQRQLLELRPIFTGLPAAASIRSPGLRAVGSPLKAPQLNYNEYRHDVGVGWLWLSARAGSLGELRGLMTERRMQGEDAAAAAAGRPARWGVGVGLLGSHGQPQRHYPDLLLAMASGHRVAVELELSAKSSGRMNRIMRAYASDSHVDQILYLAGRGSIAARVRESARRAGIGDRVHVQLLAPDGIAGAAVGTVRRSERTAGRAAPRSIAASVRTQPSAVPLAGAELSGAER